MSVKNNLLGAAATLTIAGGLTTIGTLSASAATPQCGPHCIEVFSPRFGTADQPNFVETAGGGASRIGRAGDPLRRQQLQPSRGLGRACGGTGAGF